MNISHGYGLCNQISGVSQNVKEVCQSHPMIRGQDKCRLIEFGIADPEIRSKVLHTMLLKWVRLLKKLYDLHDNTNSVIIEVLEFLKATQDKETVELFAPIVLEICDGEKLQSGDPFFIPRKKYFDDIVDLEARRCMIESMIKYVHNYN